MGCTSAQPLADGWLRAAGRLFQLLESPLGALSLGREALDISPCLREVGTSLLQALDLLLDTILGAPAALLCELQVALGALEVEELDIELDDDELDVGESEDGEESGEQDEDGEDVLDKTPEFLRDAPESDR